MSDPDGGPPLNDPALLATADQELMSLRELVGGLAAAHPAHRAEVGTLLAVVELAKHLEYLVRIGAKTNGYLIAATAIAMLSERPPRRAWAPAPEWPPSGAIELS